MKTRLERLLSSPPPIIAVMVLLMAFVVLAVSHPHTNFREFALCIVFAFSSACYVKWIDRVYLTTAETHQLREDI